MYVIFDEINGIILLAFTALPYGDDNNDIYSNDDYEDVASSANSDSMQPGVEEKEMIQMPHFVTSGNNMLVNEGSTIKLPCQVNRLGKNYLVFKRSIYYVVSTYNLYVILKTCTFLIDTLLEGILQQHSALNSLSLASGICWISTCLCI